MKSLNRCGRLATRAIPLMILFSSVGIGLVAVQPSTDPVLQAHDTLLHAAPPVGWEAVVPTGIAAEMVGFTWTGGPGKISVRSLSDGQWSDWTQLDGDPNEGPDAGTGEGKGTVAAGPAWLGHDIETIAVRVDEGEMQHLELHAIRTEPPPRNPLALPAADAAIPGPGVFTRAQWGADESFRTMNDGCNGQPDYASETRFAVVHHTVNSNNYSPGDVPALVRGIYYFHTHSNGWCDIGYNMLVDRFGGIWEGRAGGWWKPVIGAHAGGFNTYSTGVAVIGDFTSTPVPGAAYNALRTFLSWKLNYHGIDPQGATVVIPYDSPFSRYPGGQPVEVDNISGHGDVDATSCPGAYLYALLPQLRADVANDIQSNRDTRLMCDWNGNGVGSPAWFQSGAWYIRNSNSEGVTDQVISFGNPGDQPVCGDWNGDGTDTVGVFRAGVWYLRNSNTSGYADVVFGYGNPGDVPVAGDWTGSGSDKPAVFRGGAWYLKNSLVTGVGDAMFSYGDPHDRPIAADWGNKGVDGPGVYRGGAWFVRDTPTSGYADRVLGFGNAPDQPVPYVTSTTGVGPATRHTWALAIARGAYWYLSDDLTSGTAAHVFPY